MSDSNMVERGNWLIPAGEVQRVTRHIFRDRADARLASMTGDYFMRQRFEDREIESELELTNFDAPDVDNWDIWDCAQYLHDRNGLDGLDECSEWYDCFYTDPFAYIFERNEGLIADMRFWLHEEVSDSWIEDNVGREEDADSTDDWTQALWDALPVRAQNSIKSGLYVHLMEWAEDDDAWREAVQKNWETPEVYEWWGMDEYFLRRLEELGEVTMSIFNEYLWGRCTTGQAIYLDYIIEQACATWYEYYLDEFPFIQKAGGN